LGNNKKNDKPFFNSLFEIIDFSLPFDKKNLLEQSKLITKTIQNYELEKKKKDAETRDRKNEKNKDDDDDQEISEEEIVLETVSDYFNA
jgi:hypothetical protein